MTRNRGGVWSFAVGLAFFAVSLSLFLPLSLAAAGNNPVHHRLLSVICAIGALPVENSTVSIKIDSDDISKEFQAFGHSFCVLCLGGLYLKASVGKKNIVDAPVSLFLGWALHPAITLHDLGRFYREAIRGPPLYSIF